VRSLLAVVALISLGSACQPACEDRCGEVQKRCDGSETPGICADQCTIVDCVDCFRCLDEESACGGDAVCEQRCLGCSRTAPKP
jgi:hypothetical protein